MEKRLKKIEVRNYIDENPRIPATTRLSVYFDNEHDNHHVEFPTEITRGRFLHLLVNLHELIEAGANLQPLWARDNQLKGARVNG